MKVPGGSAGGTTSTEGAGDPFLTSKNPSLLK